LRGIGNAASSVSACFRFPVIERHCPSTIGDERRVMPQRAFYDHIARIGWRIRGRAERAYVERCLMKKYPLGPTKDLGSLLCKLNFRPKILGILNPVVAISVLRVPYGIKEPCTLRSWLQIFGGGVFN
jgi:hypothetical protein